MSNKPLEELKVVIDGNANPLKEELKKVRKELNETTKDVREQNQQLKKSMNEALEPTRKLKESFRKVTEGIKKACVIKTPKNQFKNMEHSIESAERKLKKLIEARNELEATGGDIEYTEEYKELAKYIEKSKIKLNSYKDNEDRMRALGVRTNSKEWKRLQYNIQEADNTLQEAKKDMDNMTSAEKFQESSKWKKVQKDIEKTRQELSQLNAEQSKYEKQAGQNKIVNKFSNLKKALKDVTAGIKKTSGTFAALLQKFKSGIPLMKRTGSSMGSLNQSGRGLGTMLKTIGLSARFMFASFLISGTINGAKEGLKNLAEYSNETNASISTLYSGLITLKNAFAVAFAPILNVVTPYLSILIDNLVSASNALSQFFSALTGKSNWTKASKVQANYAGSLNQTKEAIKSLKNELYGFDEITKQSDDDNSSSSSSGGGISAGDMFTTETVSNEFADFSKMIKEAWKNADFTGIGTIVGTKLKEELDSIDWKGIQEKCNQIAKCIGTFINGFIATEGLASSIGSTVGNAINTGVGMADTFFTITDFLTLGVFIATMANQAVKTTDFSLLGKTVADGLIAGINLWYGFITTFDFSGLGNKISESVNAFFKTMNSADKATGLTGWEKLGTSIGKTASGLADSIVTAFENIDWDGVKKGVEDLIKNTLSNLNINVGKIALVIAGIKLSLLGGKLLKEQIVKKIAGLIAEIGLKNILSKQIGKLSFSTIGSTLLGKLTIGIAAAFAVFKLSEFIGKLITGDEDFSWLGEDGYFKKIGTFITDDLGEELKKGIKGVKKKAKEWWGDVKFKVGSEFTTKKKEVQKWWTNKVKPYWTNKKLQVKNSFDTKKEEVKSWWTDKIKSWWKEKKLSVGNKLITKRRETKEWWTNKVKSWWGTKKLEVGNKLVTKRGEIKEWWTNKVKSWWGTKKLEVGNKLVTKGREVREWWTNKVKSWWGTKSLSVGASLSTTAGTVAGWASSIKSWWETHKPELNVVASIKSKIQSIAGKAEGGIYIGGSWRPVAAYEGGGAPTEGQYFIAREAGPELVGTIGGHSAVMNNDQIVSSVASGVARAVAPAVYNAVVSAFGTKQTSQQPLIVYVGGKKITDYVIKDINGRTLATGECPIKI